MPTRRRYLSDLRAAKWVLLASLVPAVNPGGRPARWSRWELVNALPHDLPPWPTVYHYFRRWRLDGVWAARRSRARRSSTASRRGRPSVAARQATTAARRSRGASDTSSVDTLGPVLAATVHPADVAAAAGARLVLTEEFAKTFSRLAHLWVDTVYRGTLVTWIADTLGWNVAIVKHRSRRVCVSIDEDPPPWPKGFQVLPRRWVVERTFAWLGRNRRLSEDYEGLSETTKAWIFLGMCRLMLRRLAT